ncbi:chain length determinant protein tyrosine kinase EpsG [Candidatus Methylopumilus turicensis]|uniref:Chain length determinant protein tyrosine kinase EpsG n=1 Tax=Candidatus Methylopumilus turicensis TaxID=1581680 RepID=A0A0B7J0H0_9PROT|nr:chain length determinant protein tyrosine kinase EpsG [Candidatus Methylopumilus turicensis]CEN56257.1 Chain length determinant protein tyrosine kinase EpsG [Candidatus Methylopumilus turicensis]
METNINTGSSTAGQPKQSPIGGLLVELGKISQNDVERIVKVQQDKGMRFGDAAIYLGLITEADINLVLSIQFNYPYLQVGNGNYSQELVAAYAPFTPQVESLRTLRTQLMKKWFSEGNKALAIVSVNPGEGGTNLTANLAILFSQLGIRTLLLDANLREPHQHELFNLTEKRGLSDILAARNDKSLISNIEAFPNLSILGAGTLAPNPQELLNRATFANFMTQAMALYDVILVDTSPAVDSADAQAIVARCGGALLVSRLDHTKMSDLAAVKAQISVTGAQIVGAVINDF